MSNRNTRSRDVRHSYILLFRFAVSGHVDEIQVQKVARECTAEYNVSLTKKNTVHMRERARVTLLYEMFTGYRIIFSTLDSSLIRIYILGDAFTRPH